MRECARSDGAALAGLPGVVVRPLHAHHDDRGTFTELFRDEWQLRRPPARWNLEHVPAGDRLQIDGELIVVLEGRARLDVGGRSANLDAAEPVLVGIDPGAGGLLHAVEGAALVGRAGDAATVAAQRPVVGADRPDLPAGVTLFDLPCEAGTRELHGPGWAVDVRPVQWNAVRSQRGVMRGVHCHPRHADLLCVARGHVRLGLADLRDGRLGVVTCLDLDASRPQIVSIPPGVAHGFLFVEPSLHVYAVDRTWDPDDELGCRWDDPQLAIPWIGIADKVSPRDAALGTLAGLRAELAAVARS